MTAAPAPAAPRPKATRQVDVRVVDPDGLPVLGALVDFFLGDTLLGTATTGERGARIRLPEILGALDVHVRLDGQEQYGQLPVYRNQYVFQFEVRARFKPFAAPVAQCADGTTGQPCVDCKIGDETYRICT
jgi:hypothetical protein